MEVLRELWGLYWALPPEERPAAQVRIGAVTRLVLDLYESASKPLSNPLLQRLVESAKREDPKPIKIPSPVQALVEQGSLEQGWRRGSAQSPGRSR